MLAIASTAFTALAFALTAATSPLPAGTVVAGVSTIDGTRTEITAFMPDGTSRVLFVEDHASGIVPKGALATNDNAKLTLAVQADGADGASVVVVNLADSRGTQLAHDVVGQRAIASQAPALLEDGSVLFVRAAESEARGKSTFDVVRSVNGVEEVVASTGGAWLTPVASAPGHFMHVESDGESSIKRFDSVKHALVDVDALGKGRVRSPALVAGGIAYENDGALVASGVSSSGVSSTKILRRGLRGLDPIVARGSELVVAGAGTKAASLVVVKNGREERTIDMGRAGIASPRAAALINGKLVAVAWLDRGESLPGELWLVEGQRARRLIEPKAGVAVEVYGVIGVVGATRGAQ